MTPRQENYRHLAETMIKKFNRRNMEAIYCDTAEDARKAVLDMIPKGASVTNGGSVTLDECGILDAVKNGDYEFIDRTEAVTAEEKRAMFQRQAGADYFLMSTNAFTEEGELVNIDGNGNRVSLLIHGPEHVIVVTGMNKLAGSTDEAIRRTQNIASPPNCVRLNCKTPCASTGLCGDCHGDGTICCQIVITRHSRHNGRITVVMVGENLGF